MIEQTITFPSDRLPHHKAAVQFVQVANRFDACIMIEHKDKIVNGKSLLGFLSLGATGGGDMQLKVDGVDEEKAMDAICQVLEEILR